MACADPLMTAPMDGCPNIQPLCLTAILVLTEGDELRNSVAHLNHFRHLGTNQHGEGIPAFIRTSLRKAVRLAAAYFTKKGTSFSTLKAEKIIMATKAGLEVC
jgi:hypothetical protein